MVGAQVEVGGRDRSHSPVRLGRERGPLVVARRRDDDLVAVLVDGARGGGRELALLLGLLLNLGNLLALLGGSADLHAQDDVSDLRLSERGHVHTAWGREGRGIGSEGGREGGREGGEGCETNKRRKASERGVEEGREGR